MDTRSIGNNISLLRKQSGLTQLALANRLGVTDKAVSRWENGLGYPDITLLPILAETFGVSIDQLLLGEKKGIAIAGNIIMDIVKSIENYPEAGMLTHISDISYSVGGCVPNTAINLIKIDRSIPVSAIGKVGTDENGRFIISTLQKNGVNVNKITYAENVPTSFCDVMSVPGGERTFFTKRGANATFSPDDVDIDALNCDILHIGYIMLLDVFDSYDEEYGTVLARFLSKVQARGIKTSVDAVSDSTGNFAEKFIPALKYCNYAIINEIECCKIWNIEPYCTDGSLNKKNIRTAMSKMIDAGVRDRVIIHCKETCFIMDSEKSFTEVASLNIPKENFKGSVGAGDAFCAGCLYGIYHKFQDKQLLEFASAAAACSLFEANAVDGMRNKNEIMLLAEKYGRYENEEK